MNHSKKIKAAKFEPKNKIKLKNERSTYNKYAFEREKRERERDMEGIKRNAKFSFFCFIIKERKKSKIIFLSLYKKK